MLISYIVITTAAGVVFQKRKQNTQTYFVAEQSLSTVVIVALLFSEIIAGAGTIGNAASAFKGGLSSVWANWGMSIGCVAFACLVLKFYRAMGAVKGAMSVPEAYYHLFDGRCRIVMVVNVVIVYIILFSTQATAAAAILSPILGINETAVAWAVTAVFIAITVMGGMKGIANMNVVHSVMMYLGMLTVAILAIHRAGGIPALKSSLPPTYFSITQPNLQTVAGQALGTCISFFAASNVVSSSFSAKSLKTARRGIILAGITVAPFALLPALIGICAKVVIPDLASANQSLFEMANLLGTVCAGLVSMAIIAAIWSTGPALLLIICASLNRDLYKHHINPHATDGQQIIFSRVMAGIVGIMGTAFGLGAKSILDQMLGAFQIRSVVGIVLVAALLWPKVTKDAAFWSMLAGGAVAAGWHFAGSPLGLQPLWPAAAACLVILIPMSLASKEKISAGHRMYRDAEEQMTAGEREKSSKKLSNEKCPPVAAGEANQSGRYSSQSS
jgi:SSS family solute:Na+ symporter